MLKAGQNDLHHQGQRQVKAQRTTGKSYAQALRAGLPKVGADLARAAAAGLNGRQLQREQYVRPRALGGGRPASAADLQKEVAGSCESAASKAAA